MTYNLDQMRDLLLGVQKPARYVGGEIGQIMKDPETVDIRVAFCFPDIYDILDKACYKAALDAYNEHLRSCGNPEVDKLDYEHEVNIPNEFQELF